MTNMRQGGRLLTWVWVRGAEWEAVFGGYTFYVTSMPSGMWRSSIYKGDQREIAPLRRESNPAHTGKPQSLSASRAECEEFADMLPKSEVRACVLQGCGQRSDHDVHRNPANVNYHEWRA